MNRRIAYYLAAGALHLSVIAGAVRGRAAIAGSPRDKLVLDRLGHSGAARIVPKETIQGASLSSLAISREIEVEDVFVNQG